jgi:hypothetical protein
LRRRCVERGVVSKSLLLQVARQPNERKMSEAVARILAGGLTRDEARRERRDEKSAGPRPQPYLFNFEPEDRSFKLRIQFLRSHVARQELIQALRSVLTELERESERAATNDAA